jgi:NOL1/NOP2/fmu family ribosome biogenesis protein
MSENADAGDGQSNVGTRFDRLPATAPDRVVEGRATRQEVLDFFADRYGIDPAVFEDYSFWERGKGKLWAFHGDLDSPVDIEALGITFLRTRQEHWKPTMDGIQRFGHHATRNVIHLSRDEAAAFLAGHDQQLEWDGDWGYLIVTHDLAGETVPLGVGLYLHGELRSQVPNGRQRDLS